MWNVDFVKKGSQHFSYFVSDFYYGVTYFVIIPPHSIVYSVKEMKLSF